MFKTGLVSVSFRKEAVEDIIAAVKAAELEGIEWGGDIHVPAGDTKKAGYVKELMKENKLTTFSYGSYYFLGDSEGDITAFVPVLESAAALGAPIIRIWGGRCGSREIKPICFEKMVKESKAIADMAAKRNIRLCLEDHANSVTDRVDFADRFVRAVGKENFGMFWQPNQNESDEYNLASIPVLADRVSNIHVFSWEMGEDHILRRFPLAYKEALWKKYLSLFAKTGKTYPLLLEFMHDDKLSTLAETAKTLKSWVK